MEMNKKYGAALQPLKHKNYHIPPLCWPQGDVAPSLHPVTSLGILHSCGLEKRRVPVHACSADPTNPPHPAQLHLSHPDV